MRKLLSIIVSFISLTTNYVSAGDFVPASVNRFLDEWRTNCASISNDISRFAQLQLESGIETIDAFIAIENTSVIDKLTSMGVSVQSIFDGFVTARIPIEMLESVALMGGVTDIEVSQRVELCTDSTLSVTHAGQVIDGLQFGLPASYDGTGVIVGVIDKGFDYQHRAFRRADNPNVTRIVRVYDTSNKTGHPALNKQGMKMPGSVFMNDEIYSLTSDGTSTHGTHTSSIAAGTHVNGYGGMAPGADIVLCSVSVLDGSLSTVEIANCIRYITCYADSVGKPCVISLSVSTPTGQHDGQDYLSKAIAQNVGKGRIFVISAGNCGDRPMYAYSKGSLSQPINLLFKSKTTNDVDSSYYYAGVNADIWMRNLRVRPSYRWHIIDLETGKIVWQGDSLSGTSETLSSQFDSYYSADPNVSTPAKLNVAVGISSNAKKFNLDISMTNLLSQQYTTINGERKSRYAIGISIYPKDTTTCYLDAWLGHSTSRFGSYNKPVITMTGDTIVDFYTGSNNDCTIGTFAVNDSIISAGAYIGRNSYFSLLLNHIVYDYSLVLGDIASYSSFQIPGAGPTGKALPTICAPGICVVAAASRYSYLANHSTTVMRTEDGSCWGVLSGTSMSAPTVAGIIALWLQANPNLSVSDVKEIIAESSIHDDFTDGEHNVQFGPNGKIDAMAGMRLVLERMNYLLGDVDNDGRVGMDDLSSLINYLLGINLPDTEFNETNADMSLNGIVDMDDLSMLIIHLLSFTY